MVKITKDTVIGFIGTGVMGKSMAEHLLEDGYPIHIYTRTQEKAKPLLNKGLYGSLLFANWQRKLTF
ncbi:3-hydroxyisobutyrate dehydrogenase [Lentibacillus sp. JNUCC-1]|nr:3-hydroxyisobutyrate dehydrogenase [Lentibacillus sp. JNUCC-1]